jgi:hypothetical protein
VNDSKIKIVLHRRAILTNLNLLYPTAIRLDTLYRTVCGYDPTYGKDLFNKDICYFVDKGWISYVDSAIGGIGQQQFMSHVIKLTADGKEIAEQTMSDPALEL